LAAAGWLDELSARVTISPPLGYLDFTALLVHAHAALTDSGGVQKEAFLARTRCVTMRDTTEWVETVDSGWNVLVDLDAERAVAALDRPLPGEHPAPYGDGHAAEHVVEALDLLA
jgi:UDP-N-acetylglucosamine 2-epimerase (non-hydrolysing)/UDP-GlcNAc3NAcA epimerase